jgi:hypothetical protein
MTKEIRTADQLSDMIVSSLGVNEIENHLRWIAWAHKLQHRQSPSLFQQALIDEPQLSLVQIGFAKPFVSFDVTLVGMHACNSFVHKRHSN